MDDGYAISADLCEEHGLVEPARVLRQIAEGVGEVFHVLNDELPARPDELPGSSNKTRVRPKRLFVSQEAAERQSARIRAAFLCKVSYHNSTHDSLFVLPEDEFCRRVGAILEIEYQLPSETLDPIIPAWAKEEQLAAIAEMLRPGFFEVIRVPINPGISNA